MPSAHSPPRRATAVHTLTPRRKPGARGGRKGSAASALTTVGPPGSAASTTTTMKAVDAVLEEEPPVAEKLAEGAASEQGDSSSEGSDSSSSDESDDDSANTQPVASPSHTTPNRPPLDRAAMISQLPPDVDTSGLSDYEILRLYNIRRNEAKLASLGLCGITSRSHPRNASSAVVRAAHEAERKKKAAAQKAAETRRRNKERADEARRAIERWERSHRKTGGDDAARNDNDEEEGGKGGPNSRSQPTRAAKSKGISYRSSSSLYASPPKRLQQWRERFSELKQFYAAHGHYRVTKKIADGTYGPLASWLARQRIAYANYKRGEKSALDEERVTLLEGLDGDWRVAIRGGRRNGAAGRRGKVLSWGGGRQRSPTARRLWRADSESDEDEDLEAEERMRREVEEGSTEEESVDFGGGSEDSYAEESVEEEGEEERYEDRRGERGGKRRRDGYYSDDAREQTRGRDEGRDGGRRARTTPRKRQRTSALATEAPLTSNWHVSSLERIDGPSRPRSATRKQSPRTQRKSDNRRPRSVRGRSSPRRRPAREGSETEEESLAPPRSKRRNTRGRDNRRPRSRRGRSSSRAHASSDAESEEEPSPRTRSGASPRLARPSFERRGSRRSRADENGRHPRPHNSKRRAPSKKPMEEIVVAPPTQLSARAERHRRREIQRRERDALLAEYGRLYGRRCAMVERRARLEYELRALHSFIASMKGAGVAGAAVGAGAKQLLNGGAAGLLPAGTPMNAAAAAPLLRSGASG